MKRTLHILLITALAMRTTGLVAQGDLCAGATVIACGATVTGNTTAFGADVAPFCGTGDGTGGGVWYRFTGTGNTITASLCGSGYDTKIRVYTGTCAALVCTVGIDDFCGLQSQVTWTSVLGTTYFILVHGFGANVGPYTLTLTCAPPPVPMCYSMTATPYAADPYAGTLVTLSDDWHSAVVNMGFGFCFNSVTYTQCVISSNNYITFNLANANTFSPWVTVAVPNATPTPPHNAVLSPWQDIHPGIGGQIRYQTLGAAPNRRFVVSYLNVPMFSCTTQLYTSQTVLYEGSNCIATFIFNKPVCATWNSGNAVHGLQNNGGTSATVVAGRNNTQWTVGAPGQGMLFTPTCNPCQTAASLDCLDVILPIELLDFRGSNVGAINLLQWATASEQNTDHFTVERSHNGEHFEPIQVVEGAGNSNWVINYEVEDAAPFEGVNYYRLRSTDIDGHEHLSNVVAVQMVHAGNIMVYPNPATSGSQYGLPEGTVLPAMLQVRDLAGRVVKRISVDALQGPLDIAGLSAGSYLPELQAAHTAATVRFMVE